MGFGSLYACEWVLNHSQLPLDERFFILLGQQKAFIKTLKSP